jgi:DNA-directed RNA polymerase specialized sigma24 family protein
MTNKTFNKVEDQMINELAVAYAGGNVEAGEKFAKVVEPLVKSYARGKYAGDMSKEDLVGEFLLVAVELTFTYAERYVGKSNFMPLLYTACENKLKDFGRGASTQKRARTIQVGDETYNREISLQAKVGEDGDSTMADLVADSQKSVEDQVIESFNEKTTEKVVKDFVRTTKGRNSQIVPLVYKANKQDWDNDKLNLEIAKVLKAEKGTEPSNDQIRQAKSRAMKALKNAILDGKVMFCNQLEWDF